MTTSHIARIKKAELLSSLGAGVLGAGIALLLPNQLVPYAIPILLLGLISILWECSRNMDWSNKARLFAFGGQKFYIGSVGCRWPRYWSSLSSVNSEMDELKGKI